MSDIGREAFEQKFPVPYGVKWSERQKDYTYECIQALQESCNYSGKWQAWQAARQAPASGKPVCARCNGQGVDPDPEPVCCGRGTAHGCCGDPEPDFGPCRDCGGTGHYIHPPAKVPEELIRQCEQAITDAAQSNGGTITGVRAAQKKIRDLLTTPTPATTPEAEWVKCEPDLLWDAESPEESCRDSAFEFADDRASDMPADETMVVNVLCAKMLPSRKMKIWVDENDDLQWEWITPPTAQEGE